MVKEYIAAFEQLAIRSKNLSDVFYIECFISGIKEAIHEHVQGHHPPNWMEACFELLTLNLSSIPKTHGLLSPPRENQ